eukprot:scaffold316295_cov18-Prasinocladus_malaysianus.AAC.1
MHVSFFYYQIYPSIYLAFPNTESPLFPARWGSKRDIPNIYVVTQSCDLASGASGCKLGGPGGDAGGGASPGVRGARGPHGRQLGLVGPGCSQPGGRQGAGQQHPQAAEVAGAKHDRQPHRRP